MDPSCFQLCRDGDVAVVKKLLDGSCNAGEEDDWDLHTCPRWRGKCPVARLPAFAADSSTHDIYQPIHYACEHSRTEVAE